MGSKSRIGSEFELVVVIFMSLYAAERLDQDKGSHYPVDTPAMLLVRCANSSWIRTNPALTYSFMSCRCSKTCQDNVFNMGFLDRFLREKLTERQRQMRSTWQEFVAEIFSEWPEYTITNKHRTLIRSLLR